MRALVLSLALLSPLVALAQIDPPTLLLPEDGGWRWVDDWQEWSEVPGAVSYRAQIDTLGGGFSDVVADTVMTGTSWWVRVSMGFYEWRVAAFDGSAWSDWSEVWTFESRFPVSNEPGASSPSPVAIERVSPNPSRGGTTVTLTLARPSEVSVAVHDVLGRRVAVLHEGPLAGGRHEVALDLGGRLAPGTYVVHATTTLANGRAAVRSQRVTVLR